MTVEPHGGGAVAGYEEDFGNLGLEDVGAGDLVIPRININHDDAVFVNSLTKEEFPALTAVVLGLVKQRIMWPPKLEDDSKPRCKSPDNTHGFPNMNENGPRKNLFPWAQSNYSPEQAQPLELDPDSTYPSGWSSNGHLTIPCDGCVFSKWGKDEDGKSTPPPCTEQHTYPILYMVAQGEGEEPLWIPALFTVQRSAIKNSKAFINGFAQSRQPMFTVYTGLTLRHESRAGNEYAVPEFKKLSPSDRNHWGEYANQLRSIREFIRSAPRPTEVEEDGSAPASNENTAPPAAATPTPPAAAAPAPPAPPAAPPAPPQAPQAPTPPASPTPTQAAPPTPPAPPAPPAAPQPPSAPQSAPAAPSQNGDADPSDLPF
jgi:hypothetical protein